MTTLEILKKARAEYERREICQNGGYFGDGMELQDALADPRVRCCVIGAVQIIMATANEDRTGRAESALRKSANELYPSYYGIIGVNDALGKEDSLKCYDHAISKMEKGLW